MGEKIIASPQLVRPSQDYLLQHTIDFYLRKLASKHHHMPIPVTLDEILPGCYVALDGHHNIAIKQKRQQEVTLWVVSSPNDFIPYALFPEVEKKMIDACNEQIHKRFNMAKFYVPSDDEGKDILSFDRLIEFTNVRI